MKLQGAIFDLYNDKNELIKENLTTDEDGKISVEELALGKYYFVETKAPDKYILEDKKYEFEIKEDKEIIKIQVTNKKEKPPIPPVTPQEEELDKDNQNTQQNTSPNTGDIGVTKYLMIVIVASITLYVLNKKDNKLI